MPDNKIKFHGRSFTTFIVALSFIIMTLSGIAIYITPAGRVANWTNWTLLGLTKHGWESVHTILSLLFLIFAIMHISFNWKTLLHYSRSKLRQGIRFKKEFIFASLLTLIITIGSIIEAPPFSAIMDFREQIKYSWEQQAQQAPVPQAEKMTFEEYCSTINIPIDNAVLKLKSYGITLNNTKTTVSEIAKNHNMSPLNIHRMIIDQRQHTYRTGSRSGGFGRMTLKDICSNLNISIDTARQRLEDKNIKVNTNETLRGIAEKYNLRPTEITDIVSGKTLAK